MKKIFVSHQTKDKNIADILVDFLIAIGIQADTIFCSSIPGNDVKEKISDEIVSALETSIIDIIVLSNNYYQSAYCQNEAGIIWYKNRTQDNHHIILIALSEITKDNLQGFIGNDYKLLRLSNSSDISNIADTVLKYTHIECSTSILYRNIENLKSRYNETILNEPTKYETNISKPKILTDNEQIILYYLLKKEIHTTNISDVKKWVLDKEIKNFNAENGFALLAQLGTKGKVEGNNLTLDIDIFRKFFRESKKIIPELNKTVSDHVKEAAISFKAEWENLPQLIKLFVAYIRENAVISFGAQWKQDKQKEKIEVWEKENWIQNANLPAKYEDCLKFFIEKEWIYESDWTSYGNPREYTLYHSLQDYLFNPPIEMLKELTAIKGKYYIPF